MNAPFPSRDLDNWIQRESPPEPDFRDSDALSAHLDGLYAQWSKLDEAGRSADADILWSGILRLEDELAEILAREEDASETRCGPHYSSGAGRGL